MYIFSSIRLRKIMFLFNLIESSCILYAHAVAWPIILSCKYFTEENEKEGDDFVLLRWTNKEYEMLAHEIVDFIQIFLVQSVEIDLKENHHFWNEHTVYGSSNLTWCLNGKKWQHFRICAQIEESLPLSRQIFQFWESDIALQHRHIKERKRAKKSERWKRFKCVWMNEKKSTNAHVHQFWLDRTLISVLRSCWSQSIGNVKSPKRNEIWMLSYLLSSIWMKLKFDLKIVFITKIWDEFWKYHENFHIVWFVLSTLNRISEP